MPIIKRILIGCRNIFLFLFISSILAVVAYKFIPVYYTPLMLTRLYDQYKGGKPFKLEHKWVPLSQIAQPLVQAVVASEDNLFLDHNGFDIEQIQKARDEAEKGKRVRGASTISQQTAKNVFLLPTKSYILHLLDRVDMGERKDHGGLSELHRDGRRYLWSRSGSQGPF